MKLSAISVENYGFTRAIGTVMADYDSDSDSASHGHRSSDSDTNSDVDFNNVIVYSDFESDGEEFLGRDQRSRLVF